MEQSADVVIVGGGVIGCAIAYYLSKAQVKVILLEQGEIGAQASSAAAGLLAPLGPLSGPGPLADLLLASFALFPTLVPELEEASGIHLAFEQTGALRTVRNPRRVGHLQKRLQAWQSLVSVPSSGSRKESDSCCLSGEEVYIRTSKKSNENASGLQVYWLTGDEARRREPLLSPDISAAIYAPQEAQISAAHVVQAFAQAARNSGAHLYSHQEVSGIQQQHSKVTGVYTTTGEVIACDHLLITTGAWAGRCGAWLNITLPVRPLRGQLLTLQQPEPALRHLIFGEALYLVPRGKSVLVGATKEEAGFDTQVTTEGISWLYETAIRLVPALKESTMEAAWAGLRPKTPDTCPILGPAPTWKNVTLAIGHNSVGILLSALTGQTIAELIITGHTPTILRPFSLERFTDLELSSQIPK